MKKIIFINYLIILIFFGGFSQAKIVNNYFYITKNFQIKLSEGTWIQVRNSIGDVGFGIEQKVQGIVRIENNEIMEMIEVYQGQFGGIVQSAIDDAIFEIVFKDKYSGCYERPEYYLLEFYKRGRAHNCLTIGHWDVHKDLTNPDDPYGKAAASAYKYWIKSNSVVYPNIFLGSNHSYFSRRASSDWYVINYAINPKALGGALSNFKTEETSEYNKNNIDNFPDHKLTMKKWISISSKRHLEFEKLTKAKKDHLLNLDSYINENLTTDNSNISQQLQKLNDLYKAGVLTEEEFKKAKSKILN